MKLEQVGRRLYFREAPFNTRERLKNAGATWDNDQRSWYVGTQKRTLAEDLVKELSAQASQPETVKDTDQVIRGRATYKGETYYVLWHGTNSSHEVNAKLCYRDGSKVFWGSGYDLDIKKLYAKPTSIKALKEFSERKAREAKTGICECWCHSRIDCSCSEGFCAFHHDGCNSCGCEQ